jgi:hypothetical protein
MLAAISNAYPRQRGGLRNTMFIRRITRFIVLGAMLLQGCGLSGSSSDHDSSPPPSAPSDLLLYLADATSLLYKINTMGESVLLSDVAGTQGVDFYYAVSPDLQRVAFVYSLDSGQLALAIKQIESGELETPNPVMDAQAVWPPQWLPDSSGLIYGVSGFDSSLSSLYLATVGEESPVELISVDLGERARLSFEISADGSRLAVVSQNFATADDFVPASSSLYLLDLTTPPQAVLIETATGDANSFKFAWSPYANELVYQRRLVTEPLSPGFSNNHPVGPLLLLDAGGASRTLREVDDEGWVSWVWLSAEQILVAPQGQFTIIATDGSLVASHTSTGNGRIVPSLDSRQLAFLDWTAGVGPEVYALEIETGEYRVLGPGSSYFVIHRSFDDSSLVWSADGDWLAWNRDIDRSNQMGELAAYDFQIAQRRVLTSEMAQFASVTSNWFSWLPQGHALEFIASTGDGFQFTVTDLTSDQTRVVGDLAATSCTVQRVWPTNDQVIWNRCGDGVFVSRQKKDGSFAGSRLIDQDIRTLKLTENRQIAVMQASGIDGENPWGNWDATWRAYLLGSDSLQELAGTGGSVCCGTLLQ